LVYDKYQKKISSMKANLERVGLPPFDVLNRTVLNRLLDTQQPVMSYTARAVLRTQLGMSAETVAPPAGTASTNAPAMTVTNAPETGPTNSPGQ
jgi:hypothetical protein